MMGNLLMYNLESGFQHGMWDLCRESGREISETLKRRCVDVCFLQKVKWKGQGVKMTGNGFAENVKQKTVWINSCQFVN